MTHYLPFGPQPRRMWYVRLVGLDPLRPIPRPVTSHQWAHSAGEAVERTAWQADALCDLPPDHIPYVWSVEPWPHEPDRQDEAPHDWSPRPGTYYPWGARYTPLPDVDWND